MIYPAVLDTFFKTYKSSDMLKNNKMADKTGLPGWKDLGRAQCLALEFNRESASITMIVLWINRGRWKELIGVI